MAAELGAVLVKAREARHAEPNTSKILQLPLGLGELQGWGTPL